MTQPVHQGAKRLLVLIPAFNEEKAVAGVVGEVRSSVPGTPILVVDDCSADGTRGEAKAAGAQVLALPHHLGLGGCVQAGYRLAYELGFDYVIRVDGDGQHDPRDIPIQIVGVLEGAAVGEAAHREASGRILAKRLGASDGVGP